MNFNDSAKSWCYRLRSCFVLNADCFYLVLKDVVNLMGTFNRSNKEKRCTSKRRKMIFQNNSLEESFVISAVTVHESLYYLFFLLKFISWDSKPAWYIWMKSGKACRSKTVSTNLPHSVFTEALSPCRTVLEGNSSSAHHQGVFYRKISKTSQWEEVHYLLLEAPGEGTLLALSLKEYFTSPTSPNFHP